MAPKRAVAKPLSAGSADILDLWPGSGGNLPRSTMIEAVRHDFEDFGLNGNQARVLLALLRGGSASATQLARLADVSRTGVYPVLEELRDRGLALPLAGKSSLWTAPDGDEVLSRLYAVQEERLAAIRQRMESTRENLAKLLPSESPTALPFVQFVRGAAQTAKAYEQLLCDAQDEFVMFTRPPYAWSMPKPNPVVLATLARGIACRVLYQQAEWEDPSAAAFRAEMNIYHREGVDARLTDALPIKLVVVDRKAVLVSMPDAVRAGYPTTLLIEHAGYAEIQADAFERRWETAHELTVG